MYFLLVYKHHFTVKEIKGGIKKYLDARIRGLDNRHLEDNIRIHIRHLQRCNLDNFSLCIAYVILETFTTFYCTSKQSLIFLDNESFKYTINALNPKNCNFLAPNNNKPHNLNRASNEGLTKPNR